MSKSGVPWAGIVMTSVVYVLGSILNFFAADAFEIALEAAAIGVVFTWSTIFLCQLRLRQLTDRGVIPATDVGGSARQNGIPVHDLQRDTSTFNSYFTAARYGAVGGAFEKNKVDNVYSLYTAGGAKWMVLTLELWPRKSVVEWAETVVASHADYNVVVVTHDYLEPNGQIGTSDGGYGDTSPTYLYDKLIGQYANIRMVLSGHVGIAGSRVDTGENGNKIYTFASTFHSNTTNPIRMFEIDTKTGSLKTWVYAPYNKQTWPEYAQTFTGVSWVK